MRGSGFVLSLIVCLIPTWVRAENWPGWRGPRGDGTSTEKNVPRIWSATENIRWKTSIPGKGHSSPIVWGERVFVTTCLEDKGERVLICLDRRDGKLFVEDLGSTNGTFLNRKPVSGTAAIRKGDRLQVGKTVLEVGR